MEAKDLMIGNLVYDPFDHCTVSIVNIDFIAEHTKNFRPIPLTEEWLLKFGFVEHKERGTTKYWNDFEDMAIMVSLDFDFYVCRESYEGETLRNLKYVHQLQNLYFAITGEELTIKE